jgi:dUTP pyrophosphatase
MADFSIDGVLKMYSNYFGNKNENFAILKLSVNKNNQELLELYKEHIEKHNNNMKTDYYHNAGFDLFIPNETIFENKISSKFIDLEIKTEMLYFENANFKNCGYYMHPRSSISKTPLMLANHTGIVDSGYRGSLIGAFRWLKMPNQNSYILEKHTRLLQICHPSLCRIIVCLVNDDDLSTTARGEGGFGSTGIIGL